MTVDIENMSGFLSSWTEFLINLLMLSINKMILLWEESYMMNSRYFIADKTLEPSVSLTGGQCSEEGGHPNELTFL